MKNKKSLNINKQFENNKLVKNNKKKGFKVQNKNNV